MKKLVIALVALVGGFTAWGSSVDWSVDCYEMSSSVSGYTLYLFTDADAASTYAGKLADKSYSDASDFTDAAGSATKTLDGDSVADGFLTGVSSSGYLSALLIASTAEGAQIYYTSGFALSGHTYEDGEPPATPIEIWDTDFTRGSVIAYGGGIPEPTSGLLLLLGGAMLALRRRRA